MIKKLSLIITILLFTSTAFALPYSSVKSAYGNISIARTDANFASVVATPSFTVVTSNASLTTGNINIPIRITSPSGNVVTYYLKANTAQ